MKVSFLLLSILALTIGPASAEAPALVPPGQVRRGEPGFVLLAPLPAGSPSADFTLVLTYANGWTSPGYPGFAAPGPVSGLEVKSTGPSADSRHALSAVFLFSAPVDAALGEASMLVFSSDGNVVARATIMVADRTFAQEDLRLDAALTGIRVDPDPRKTEQALRYQAVLATVDPTAVFLDAGFVKPVETERRTSAFGLRRRYLYASGAEDVTTHNGIDYGSPTGSLVISAGAGRVVMAEDRVVTGKTIILEHLPGAFTIYMHLDTMAVQVGAVVARGVPIGTVGKTGLATGPHLHWEFRIRGVACDPEALVGLDKTPSIRRIVPAIEGG